MGKLGVDPVARIEFRLHPDLKDLIGTEADKTGLPMNELLSKILAEHFGRPELATIPRKSFGRPRKERVPA